MEDKEEKAYAFWRRVDALRKGTLQELADVMQIREQSLRVMRSRCSMPRALAVKALAEYLGTTSNYLLTGEDGAEEPTTSREIPEVEYVRKNPEARALIRAVMNNSALLSAFTLVIESIGTKIDTNNAEKTG